jgi:hypothetical protein
MRKSNFWALFSVTIVASFVFLRCTETGDSSLDKVDDVEADSGVKSDLSPVLPFDVTITGDKLETTILHDFDLFSWQSFIALSWSTDDSEMIGINGDNSTKWETWKNAYDIFLENGETPQPWGTPGQYPSSCTDSNGRLLIQVGKTPDLLTASEQPFKTGPLIDQNGLYTRFEIVVNQEMFNYIYNNDLYSFDGQGAFNQNAEFPSGDNADSTWGAIMVKAAWKVIGDGDDASKFHCVEAAVYTPASTNPAIPESCVIQKVGLVGLHIGTKTTTSPQWIWSTFEHVDNAPTFNETADKAHYNYYKKGSDREINASPEQPWDPNRANQIPTQVERLIPIDPVTAALNKEFQGKLRAVNEKSVWQYYELVGTQWPVDPTQSDEGNPFPVYLGNATLETYIQGIVQDGKVTEVPGVSSSCIHCHNGAMMSGAAKQADFTYLLKRAK